MIEYPVTSRHLASGWQALLASLRARFAAANMITGSVGAVLALMPAGAAWPAADIADAFASGDILEWVKGSLGLIVLLRRRLRTDDGGRQ